MATTKKSGYGADSIVVLEGLEPVRKRPAMYIGTTSQYGVNHCLNEIIDNSIDEALAGFCHNIEIRVEDDGYMTVIDDGRGIPVDKVSRTLGYVFVGEVNLNIELVRNGLARVVLYEKRAKIKYQDELLLAEKEAKEKKVGIWKKYN